MRKVLIILAFLVFAWLGFWSGFDYCFRLSHDENIAQARLNASKIAAIQKWLNAGEIEKVNEFLDVDGKMNQALASDALTSSDDFMARVRPVVWPQEYLQYIRIVKAKPQRHPSDL